MSRSSCPTTLPSKPDFLQNIPLNMQKEQKHYTDKIQIFRQHHVKYLQFLLMPMSHKMSWPKRPFSDLLKYLVMLHFDKKLWDAPPFVLIYSTRIWREMKI